MPGLATFSIADSAPAFHEVTQLVPHECVVRMDLGIDRLARSTKGGKFCAFPLRIGRSSLLSLRCFFPRPARVSATARRSCSDGTEA